MSGNTSDRSQQSALDRLRVMQETAEFLRQTLPSLWAEEPELPGMRRDGHSPYDAPGHEHFQRAAREAALRLGVLPAGLHQEVEYYGERAIPIPGANQPTGGRTRQPSRELPNFFQGAYGGPHARVNGRANGYRAIYNGNGNAGGNGRHEADDRDYRESGLPQQNANDPGHRRRSE